MTTAHAETSNVSDDTLLSIWKEGYDLQRAFSEVLRGNLDNLRDGLLYMVGIKTNYWQR